VAEKKKSPVGRPTKYKTEYCEQLIDHMAKGFSYETFGAVIGVMPSTIYLWEQHPEFSEAKKMAFAKCRLWWEQQGQLGLMAGERDPKLNSPVWIFNMKNRFNWTDKRESSTTIDANIKQESVLAKEVVDELRDLLKTGINERKQS
jgi:hypothetical protein